MYRSNRSGNQIKTCEITAALAVIVCRDTLICGMTLDELEREYLPLRQQADAVRSYL